MVAWQFQKNGENLFDGDGNAVKTTELTKSYTLPEEWSPWGEVDTYHLYSSVTKQKIIDLNPDGTFQQFHVYYSGTKIVEGIDEDLTFHVTDPITGSMWKTDGNTFPKDNNDGSRVELAGLQTSLPTIDPGANHAPNYGYGGFPLNPESGCTDAFHASGPANKF